MSKKADSKTLKDVLSYSDEQLISNWAKLASLIKKFENVSWQEASTLARGLIKDGDAISYISEVRVSAGESIQKTSTSKKKKSSQKKKKVVPLNTARDRLSLNYKRLLQIAPDLDEKLETGEAIYGKSKSSGYMDLNLELVHTDKTGYYVALSHYYKQNGDMIPDPDMQILVDVRNQKVEALAFQNSIYYREVYDDIYNRKLVRLSEKKSQNAFLEKWLLNLKEQGHQIEWIEEDTTEEVNTNIEEKSKDEPNLEFPQKPDVSFMDEKVVLDITETIEKTVLDDLMKLYSQFINGKKEVRPVAQYFLIDRLNTSPLGISIEYPSEEEIRKDYQRLLEFYSENRRAEEMTREMESPTEESQEIEQEIQSSVNPPNYISRFKALSKNQLLKLNYQKMLRLVPKLFELESDAPFILSSKKSKSKFKVFKNPNEKSEFSLGEIDKGSSVWIFTINKRGQKLSVKSYQNAKESIDLNIQFAKFLEDRLLQGFKKKHKTYKEVLKTHPIVIEWAERSSDENVGIKNLEKLQEKLLEYPVMGLNEGYTKVKAWFRDYPSYVRIDLSESKGDYDPKNQELDDWLEDYDGNFDWWQYSKESRKEKLKKEALKIPDFEVGKVKLVKAHKRAGITQKHIDWINKHKQGLTVTPIKRMVNKTKSFEADVNKGAQRPGFRISRTGKLYYETRSNRSDMTGAGL